VSRVLFFDPAAPAAATESGDLDAMGALSIGHILAVAAVVTLLFGGRGRISGAMGDAAKGLRAFREGLKDEALQQETAPPPAPPVARTRVRTQATGL
jgi:sec-independent protein translocase protein TatA